MIWGKRRSSKEGAGVCKKGRKHHTSYHVGEKSPGTNAKRRKSGKLKKGEWGLAPELRCWQLWFAGRVSWCGYTWGNISFPLTSKISGVAKLDFSYSRRVKHCIFYCRAWRPLVNRCKLVLPLPFGFLSKYSLVAWDITHVAFGWLVFSRVGQVKTRNFCNQILHNTDEF